MDRRQLQWCKYHCKGFQKHKTFQHAK